MDIYMGSARIGENGKTTGGKVGDQKQTSAPDYKGEVSMQTLASFVSGRKLYVIRAKQCSHAQAIGNAMKIACNNKHLGYNQNNRLGVVTYGVNTTRDTECDCSSLVRACIKYATGKDVGNFTTANAVTVLDKSGLFDKAITYTSSTKIYEGDILVTQSKGHIGICTDGYSRQITSLVRNGANYAYVFDPIFYADKYPDLKKAFGYDAKALFKHFCDYGMKEGRQGSTTFNVEVYKERYTDLKDAYGNNLPAYYLHYCVYGVKEGRKGI